MASDVATATTQLTATRIHIEQVTSLRRDTRKAHVALLEVWLASPTEKPARRAAVERMVATVVEEHEAFRQLTETEADEGPIRARLAQAQSEWTELMRATLREQRGPEKLEDHQRALAAVDREADGVLKLNSKSGEAVDGAISALRARQGRIEQAFLGAVFAAIGAAILWQARRRHHARLLEAQRREEAAAVKLRGQFFASMSHELRTPLVAITNLTKTFDHDADPTARRKVIGHIDREAKELLVMINNILDLAKLESDHVELLIEDVAIRDVLERCAERCRPLVAEKPVELSVEAPNSLHARGDFVKLQQVFTNLLANAIKFTERGSVKVTARSTERGDIEVVVEDTGIGIEPQALDSIWSAFRQADSRISKSFGGTGLGLAIVKGVLDRTGGTIHVESTVGRGTRFVVTLPPAAPRTSPPRPAS